MWFHARLRRSGLLGQVLDTGTDGYLTISGRQVTWTQQGKVVWSVDASEVRVARAPDLVHYDLILDVRGQRWDLIVDARPVQTWTPGLLIARRRRDAARAALQLIEAARRLPPGPQSAWSTISGPRRPSR